MKISDFSELTGTMGANDYFSALQSGSNKKVKLSTVISSMLTTSMGDYDGVTDTRGATEKAIRYAIEEVDRWSRVATSRYTSTPASTSRITMSDTSYLYAGLPVKYDIGSVHYHGIITAVATNSYIDIAGAPLSGTINYLWVGKHEMVRIKTFYVAGNYADDAADLLDADNNQAFRWEARTAMLVAFSVKHKTDDSGTQPYINIKVDGALVSTENTNDGPQVGTSWVSNSAVAIDTTNYQVDWHDDIEVRCTVAGGTGDASDLSVHCVFVDV